MGQSVALRPKSSGEYSPAGAVEFAIFETACGWMALVGHDNTVHQLHLGYVDPADLRSVLETDRESIESDWFPELRETLQAYAAGQPVTFAKVRCELPKMTAFQAKVIEFVRRIPYGQVLSYGDVAAAVGNAGAARAVGTVMSSNRIPIIIPCHRIVAAGGKLGGYSAPRGIELKQWLLDLEQTANEFPIARSDADTATILGR
jgi:methylated-DNA-[protein]-cysteine S-methyltransferase